MHHAVAAAGGLANDGSKRTDATQVFKVLVLDRATRELIGPLITLQELRRHGVTLVLSLEAKREAIDSPAVYLCSPTEEAVRRVAKDAREALYSSISVNFAAPVKRDVLEVFADAIVGPGGGGGDDAARAAARVSCVRDQYVLFSAPSKSVFTLLPSAAGTSGGFYSRLNAASTSDTDIERAIGEVVEGLFATLVTLGVVPVIKAQSGGPAEMVARQLDGRIKQQLETRSNLFTASGAAGAVPAAATASRPYMFIFDRNIDLAVAVQHGWNYEPLVHDLLGLKSNRVVLGGGDASSSPSSSAPSQAQTSSEKKTYDLDESDFFWSENATAVFPEVAGAVEAALKKYKEDMDAINKKTALSNDVGDGADGVNANTKGLKAAVESLPELTARKRVIDKHTNIATSLLGIIKARGIDAFNTMEEDMLAGAGKVDVAEVMRLLQDKDKGSAADKLRLAIVFMLTQDTSSPSEMEGIEAALRDSGADLSALHNVRRIKSLMGGTGIGSGGGAGGGQRGQNQPNILDWADKLYGQGLDKITKGVKSLMSGGRELPVTRMVEAIMDGKQASDAEGILTLDPKREEVSAAISSSSGLPQSGMRQDAIVFMVGGTWWWLQPELLPSGVRFRKLTHARPRALSCFAGHAPVSNFPALRAHGWFPPSALCLR